MHVQSSELAAAGVDDPMIDGSYIDSDLGIVSRTRRNYIAKQILPQPDANLQGKDMWLLSTYRRFKADLLAGRFAVEKRPPHLKASKSSAAVTPSRAPSLIDRPGKRGKAKTATTTAADRGETPDKSGTT